MTQNVTRNPYTPPEADEVIVVVEKNNLTTTELIKDNPDEGDWDD